MKKRVYFNLLLVALIILLVYLLIASIREPIAFQREKAKRELAVIEKLIEIRQAQELFRGVKGGFAPSFDSLVKVLTRDSFRIVKVIGDPDDPNFTGEITYDTTYIPAIDSVRALGLNLDSLKYVPYTHGDTFQIAADTLTYQKTLVNVVEVGVSRRKFMGKWGSKKYAKYDNSYDPDKVIKFGDLNKPTLAGNWEN